MRTLRGRYLLEDLLHIALQLAHDARLVVVELVLEKCVAQTVPEWVLATIVESHMTNSISLILDLTVAKPFDYCLEFDIHKNR